MTRETAVIGNRGAYDDGGESSLLQEEVTVDVQGATEIRLRELALEEKKLAIETRRMELEAEREAANWMLRKRHVQNRVRIAKDGVGNVEDGDGNEKGEGA